MKVDLNRYDGRLVLDQLRIERVKPDRQGACIELTFNDGSEFDFVFPTSDPTEIAQYFPVAKEVLVHLAAMDNEVQRKCAAECAKSGLHSRNYEGAPACARLGPGYVVLRYWGTGVNTEWDEKFDLINGQWVNDAGAA